MITIATLEISKNKDLIPQPTVKIVGKLPVMAAKLTIKLNKGAERALARRAERLKPTGAPIDVGPVGRSIHFLRGVNSRAMMTLPAFYLFLGANLKGDRPCAIVGYPGVVLKHALRFSSVGTISLSCRKAFDHAAKGLTGANFSKSSDEILAQVAEYWSGNSGRSFQEALQPYFCSDLYFVIVRKQPRCC